MFGYNLKTERKVNIDKIDPMQRLREGVMQALSKTPSGMPGTNTTGQKDNGDNPMMFLQPPPKPTYNTKEQQRLQRISKTNSIGQAIGSLFQLAGVASGGDAQNLGNNSNQYVLKELEDLDNEYKNQLQNHSNQLFNIDRYNTETKNRQTLAEISEQQRIEAEQRNQDSQKREYMMKMGVNPDLPNADELLYNKIKEVQDLDKKNTESLISARKNQGRGRDTETNQDFANYLMAGRNAKISELQSQIAELRKGDSVANADQIKSLTEQIETIRGIKIDPNSSLAQELARLGMSLENQEQNIIPEEERKAPYYNIKLKGTKGKNDYNQNSKQPTKTPSNTDYLFPGYDKMPETKQIEKTINNIQSLQSKLKKNPNDDKSIRELAKLRKLHNPEENIDEIISTIKKYYGTKQ